MPSPGEADLFLGKGNRGDYDPEAVALLRRLYGGIGAMAEALENRWATTAG